ncbi:HAD-IA family hydrolase [Polyangium aurulentum]|uniref:HAD-IA family hydrolase n=1 Tax=Polyangium aurulentum TaxID=2567896 RepID=UPI0019814F40|nr:HAD-IA family hydrolase [Polyangium aurulentum]
MRRYTTVLFDLDGTLIDSIKLILDSYRHTFARHGLPAQADEHFLRGIGTPLAVQLAFWATESLGVEALIQTYRTYNLANHDTCVKAYPGAVECVRALVAAGIRLGVVTSKNRDGTLRGLAIAGLVDAFEVLVCSDDVTNGKPHREPVDRAVELLGARREETLFVGDSIHDMLSGRHAEVHTAAALWGPFKREELVPSEPTHWAKTPGDVVDIVLG